MGNTQNKTKNWMEQQFQYWAQNVQHNKQLDTFVAHFAQHFYQKLCLQQYHQITKSEIIYTVDTIGSIKTYSKSSCDWWMKDILEIISFHEVGMENGLKSVQRYTIHFATVWESIDLPRTDDTLKVKESQVFLRILFRNGFFNEKKSR